jgi:hypothetical protein
VRWLAVPALLALALGGCAAAKVPKVGEDPPEARDESEKAYRELLERFTSSKQIYAGFDTRLFAGATYQSDAFVEARVKRRGHFLAEPPEVIAAQLEKERAELAPFYEFFLGVHLNNSKYDDFDRKDSIWRVALVTSGGEAKAEKIERVGRSNLDLRSIYPYLDDFWVGYTVKVKKDAVPAPTGKLILRVASSLGQADLEFPAQ